MILAAVLVSGLAASASASQPAPSRAFFESHRETLLSRLPADSIAVFHSAPETSVETSPEPYRQDSEFWYLTGFEEPNAVVLLVPSASKESRYILFVQPKDFLLEQWTGWRSGLEGAKKEYGAGQAYPIGELWDRLAGSFSAAQTLYYGSGGDNRERKRDVRAPRRRRLADRLRDAAGQRLGRTGSSSRGEPDLG